MTTSGVAWWIRAESPGGWRRRWRDLASLVLAVLLAIFGSSSVSAQRSTRPVGRFVAESVTVGGRTYPYSIYLPPGFTRNRRWPAILGLHGSASRGRSGLAPRTQSVVVAARRYPSRYRAILILPQCPSEETWLGDAGRAAWLALEQTLRGFPIDSNRVYLAGQSMGADGGFQMLGEHPGTFAAFLAVAVGWGNPTFEAERLATVPIRVFHGTKDKVPIERARSRVARIKTAGGSDVELRPFPGRGHDIFDDVYQDSTVSTWLFERRRGSR